MKDDAIRAAYKQYQDSNANLADKRDCPSPDVLASLAGRPSSSPDLALLDHVLSCPRCQPEFDLLRAVAAAGESMAGDGKRANRSSRRWISVATAAALLVAAGLAGESWRRSTAAPELRAGDSVGGVTAPGAGAGDLNVVAPLETISAIDSVTFVWRSVDGAALYAIDFLDLSGAVIATRTTGDTTLVVDDLSESELLAQLRVAKLFDWVVVARRGDGNERRSPVVRVRIR